MERTESPQAPTPASTLAARRRLLRGAIAAPTLMTVCTGSALANASSLRCLSNAQKIPLPPGVPVGSPATDGYVRVQLWMVTFCDNCAPNPPVPTYFVRGQDLAGYVLGAGMPTASQWQVISLPQFISSGTPILPLSGPGYSPATAAPHYVLIRFDAEGRVVGFGGDVPGAALGASCWVSAGPYIKKL